jgi:riboflavin kinase/FMN adenylyltransferase
MRVIDQLEGLSAAAGPVVLAAGYFDGVHRGHQAVIRTALARAQESGAETWVLTMDPHPLRILRPDAAPRLLTSTPHKLRLLGELGVAGCVVLPFTVALAAVEPADFIARLRAAAPRLVCMVVGPNWTFGRGARGTPDTLRELARAHGFDATIAEPVLVDGQPISSTRIREAVLLGQLDEAARLLGRPFGVRGTVVRGKQLGRRLGFPTANVDAEGEVRPPPGIYAVQGRHARWRLSRAPPTSAPPRPASWRST